MASIGQIIFGSMICLIVVMSGIIVFILAIAFSVSQGTVESISPSTVGNLDDDVMLGCRFLSNTVNGQFSDVSITWLKDSISGVVYEYKNKAAQLQTQNAQFSNRAQLFPDSISTGNASLLLRNIRLEDDGVYRCTVNAAKVSGTAIVKLRVAAFSAPTFTELPNGSLSAVANKWFPQPEVNWYNQSGQILNSSTSFFNIAGIIHVSSLLQDPAKENETYRCLIQNSLVIAVSEATVTAHKVTQSTYFIFNAASTKRSSLHLLVTVLILLYGVR
ncbi:V-set domain-containing T-cell activation inhibitor 1 [Danio aesculapii]|uniref:V-set domain-containing T-cell activation inhibitor 1 n=1 Tax=Danio aesculapii TaxID=1142201 RepID=UPI0024BFA3E5|nr:V-set domain-containing T-cell activation inhibitor 1 [Danio aesculapii]